MSWLVMVARSHYYKESQLVEFHNRAVEGHIEVRVVVDHCSQLVVEQDQEVDHEHRKAAFLDNPSWDGDDHLGQR